MSHEQYGGGLLVSHEQYGGDSIETIASTGSEWLFVGMGLTGVFVYQLLEHCAIYYTNASNVAILVSVGTFCPKGESIYCNMWIGAAEAICGVAPRSSSCGGEADVRQERCDMRSYCRYK